MVIPRTDWRCYVTQRVAAALSPLMGLYDTRTPQQLVLTPQQLVLAGVIIGQKAANGTPEQVENALIHAGFSSSIACSVKETLQGFERSR